MGKKKKGGDFSAAMANLEDCNDLADSTTAQMKAQTAQLDSMNAAMDDVNDLCAQADKATSELEDDTEPAWWELFLGAPSREEKQKKARQKQQEAIFEEAKKEAEAYEEKPPIKEGWLQQRGAFKDEPWEARWCCLHPTVLSLYEDDKKEVRTGDIVLTEESKVHLFTKGLPPGDALWHRAEHPFGFLLDPDAEGPKWRPLFYFDGEDRSKMLHWVKHIDRAVKLLELKAEKAEEDAGLIAINSALDGLDAKAKGMGDEAKKQAELVEQLDKKVDQATESVDKTNERLEKILES